MTRSSLSALFMMLGAAACSSPASDSGDDPALTDADRERIGTRATEQAREGAEILIAPSSFPAVATWTAYVGTGLTVVGADATGARRVVMGWVVDGDRVTMACSMAAASRESCVSVVNAMAKDVRWLNSDLATASLATANLHFLQQKSDANRCDGLVGTTLEQSAEQLGATKEEPAVPVGTCNLNVVLSVGCLLFQVGTTNGSGARHDDLAKECSCGDQPNQLVCQSRQLVSAGPNPARVECIDECVDGSVKRGNACDARPPQEQLGPNGCIVEGRRLWNECVPQCPPP